MNKLPPQLQAGHTLKSINDTVLKRYSDRPQKLLYHLPFSTVPKPDMTKPLSRVQSAVTRQEVFREEDVMSLVVQGDAVKIIAA